MKTQLRRVRKVISKNKVFSHCPPLPLTQLPLVSTSSVKQGRDTWVFLKHCVNARSFCYYWAQRLGMFLCPEIGPSVLSPCHHLFWKRETLPILGTSKWGQQIQGNSPWNRLWRPQTPAPTHCPPHPHRLCDFSLQSLHWPVLLTL